MSEPASSTALTSVSSAGVFIDIRVALRGTGDTAEKTLVRRRKQ
jgi:hypothetical protein